MNNHSYVWQLEQVSTLQLTYLHRNSRKEPNFFFRVEGHIMPAIAVECGWSESITRIYNNMNLLLMGGDGSIRVVIIVKWRKLQGGVSGTVELFNRDRNDMPRCEQSEVCPDF